MQHEPKRVTHVNWPETSLTLARGLIVDNCMGVLYIDHFQFQCSAVIEGNGINDVFQYINFLFRGTINVVCSH